VPVTALIPQAMDEDMAHFYDQALAAYQRNDLDTAFQSLNAALGSNEAANPNVLALLGRAFLKAGLADEAAEAFEAAAAKAGGQAFPILKTACNAFDEAGLGEKAFLFALKAQKLDPNDHDIVYAIAKELAARGERDLLAHFKNRLTASDDPKHLDLAKQLIGADNRNPFNLVLFKKLARLTPDDHFTRFKLMSIAREFCDYETIEAEESWMRSELAAGREWIFEGETPYANLLHCADPRRNRLATNNRAIDAPPAPDLASRRRAMPHLWGEKIRIGYLSADFGSTHATMRLLRHVLELHDRARFNVTLYCYSPDNLIAADDGGRAQWGRILRVDAMSDAEAAERIRTDGIDILVDLKGHTGGSRAQILNHAPAPIHVAWLGFPGSTVNVDLDYVICDRFVLPDSDMAWFHEKPCRLPHSYQPNDPAHRPLPPPASRASLGLPEDKFVFASFNAARKITLETLDLWIAILQQAPSGILWVMIDAEQARQNFRNYVTSRGIAAERIVFAQNADYPEHIARLQAADLGLDSFPYNGHTTTSDMLWAGLPVLTKAGSNFASRVSESLLNACGLPDLVAADGQAFIERAVAFAGGDDRLQAYRRHLSENQQSLPLFDSVSFCRGLESAYELMADRAKRGLPPDIIDLHSRS
jgi:predicted O-linked N-acetylglucosamine transferase (SPINDLY family)